MKLSLLVLLSLSAPTLFAQINWQHTQGPQGGGYSPIYHNEQYAFYPDEYNLYRSADGLSWEQLPYENLWPMAISPTTIAALQGSGFNYAPATRRFLVSHDNGATWLEGTLPPTNNGSFSNLAVCTHGIYVPAGTKNAIFRSQDDGLTWDSIAPPGLYTYDLWAFEDKLYAEWYSKFWRLEPNGIDWIQVSPNFGAQEYPNAMFATGDQLLFATENNLWGSPDGGITWKKTAIPFHNSSGEFIQIGDRIYKDAGTTGLMYTKDFGVSWAAVPLPNDYNIFRLGTAGGRLLGSSYAQGVFRLEETSNQLVPALDGLYSAAVYFLEPNATKLWAACGNGVFAYDLAAKTWSNSSLLIPQNYYTQVTSGASGKTAALDVYNYQFYLSSDAGASWDTIEPYPPFSGGSIKQLIWLDDVLLVKGDFSQDRRSTDFGLSWTSTSCPQQVAKFQGKYFGLWQGSTSFVSSSDLGLTWSAETVPAGLSPYQLYATADYLFLNGTKDGTNRLLYRSTDGIQWEYAGAGLPDIDIQSPSFDEIYHGGLWQKDGKFYLYDRSDGFFASIDDCQTWLPLEYRPYNYMAMVDTTFYTGGFGGGVLQTGLPQQYGALSSGLVFKDDNNDGLQDPGEIPLPFVQVQVHEPGAWHPFWMSTTQVDGRYTIGSTPGSMDTLRVRVKSPYVGQINPPYQLVNGSGTDRNFGVHFNADVVDLSIVGNYAGRPRPGFNLNIYLNYENAGTLPAAGTVSLRLDPKFQFAGAEPAPSAVFGDSLVWNVAQLSLFERQVIRVSGSLPAAVPLGSLLKMYGHIEAAGPDVAPQNNHLVLCDTVVGSFDPNEKRVEPALGLTAAEVEAGKELHYTIQFQNTGTYPAERVRITDQLDTALQLNTLRLVASSHPVSTFRLLPGGLLEIIFDPINLPDSLSNEVESHGFVTLAIQRNKAYRAGYLIKNKAAIHFDYNEPIVTNTVSSGIIATPVSTDGPDREPALALHIFPNPAPSGFTVYSDGRLRGAGELEVLNLAGQLCFRQRVPDLSQAVQVKAVGLPEGLYLVRISGRDGVLVGKLVVAR